MKFDVRISQSVSLYVEAHLDELKAQSHRIKLNRENESESNFMITCVNNILSTQRSQCNVLCEQPLTRTSLPKSTPHQYLRIPLGLP